SSCFRRRNWMTPMNRRPNNSRSLWTRIRVIRSGPPRLDRERLVRRLPPVEYRRAPDEQQLFDEVSLPASVPLMLELDQETEYLLCRKATERLLGFVPDPHPPE